MKTQIVAALVMLAGLLAGAASWTGVAIPVAQAEHPELVDDAVAYLQSLRTVHLQTTKRRVRVDFEHPALAVTYPGGMLRWDGTEAVIHLPETVMGIPDPIPVPPELEQRIADVFDELQAGFVNTTFVEGEDPRTVDPEYHISSTSHWYRVVLPFAWAAPYKVFVSMGASGRPGRLAVFNAATGESIRYRDWLDTREISLGFAAENVPLAPDVYSTDRPTWPDPDLTPSWKFDNGGRPYHEEVTRLRLTYDEAVSTGRNLSGDPMPGLAMRYVTCPQAPKTTKLAGTLVWAFPEDPAEAARALAATAECPVKFRMEMNSAHIAGPGQRTCLRGDWMVLDTAVQPPAVRWSRHIDECKPGPVAEDVPWTVEWTLEQGADPTAMEVRFDGEVEVRCAQVTSFQASAVLKMNGTDQPMLRWHGCYPGWEP